MARSWRGFPTIFVVGRQPARGGLCAPKKNAYLRRFAFSNVGRSPMHKLFAASFLSLAVGLGGAVSIASAQDMTPAVKSGPPSVDWPISDLLADSGAHDVLA